MTAGLDCTFQQFSFMAIYQKVFQNMFIYSIHTQTLKYIHIGFKLTIKSVLKLMKKREILVTSHRNIQATQTGCKTMESQLVCAFSTMLNHWYNKHMDIYMTILTTGQ